MKIDLHLHSPASKCFQDKDLPDVAEKMVQKALDEDLKIIGLTDHHTTDFIGNIQKAARGSTLIVLPGVELSFNVGGFKNIYILALFKGNTPGDKLDHMLKKWNIPDSAKGNCHYRMEVGVNQVIADIRQCGGIVLSGHVDKDETRKRAIPLLVKNCGVELFDLKHFQTAQEIQHQFSQPIHCFTFSDSHRIADIGRRYSEIDPDNTVFANFVNTIQGNE